MMMISSLPTAGDLCMADDDVEMEFLHELFRTGYGRQAAFPSPASRGAALTPADLAFDNVFQVPYEMASLLSKQQQQHGNYWGDDDPFITAHNSADVLCWDSCSPSPGDVDDEEEASPWSSDPYIVEDLTASCNWADDVHAAASSLPDYLMAGSTRSPIPSMEYPATGMEALSPKSILTIKEEPPYSPVSMENNTAQQKGTFLRQV